MSIFYSIHEISSAYIGFLILSLYLADHLFGKELLIRFPVRVLCGRLSISVCSSFPFGFEGGMWDLIVLIPGHKCISINFSY